MIGRPGNGWQLVLARTPTNRVAARWLVHHRWLVIVVALVLSGCSTITMRISRNELQSDLAKRFPREVDKHVVTFRANDPRIDFPGQPEILGVRLRVEVTSASGNSRLAGTVRVEGELEYVASDHAFYLRDPKVTELVLNPAEGSGALSHAVHRAHGALGEQLVERAVRSAIEELLSTYPVYRLDARRSEREAKAIRHLRSAHIDGQDLVLEVGL